MFCFPDIIEQSFVIPTTEAASSNTIGWVALGILISVVGMIALSDLSNFSKGVQLMYFNVVHGKTKSASTNSGKKKNGNKSSKKSSGRSKRAQAYIRLQSADKTVRQAHF